MTYEIPKPPPSVTEVLHTAQTVLGEHIKAIELAAAPVVAPDLVRAIELSKQIIETRRGTPA